MAKKLFIISIIMFFLSNLVIIGCSKNDEITLKQKEITNAKQQAINEQSSKVGEIGN